MIFFSLFFSKWKTAKKKKGDILQIQEKKKKEISCAVYMNDVEMGHRRCWVQSYKGVKEETRQVSKDWSVAYQPTA